MNLILTDSVGNSLETVEIPLEHPFSHRRRRSTHAAAGGDRGSAAWRGRRVLLFDRGRRLGKGGLGLHRAGERQGRRLFAQISFTGQGRYEDKTYSLCRPTEAEASHETVVALLLALSGR
jgi:hypothetical protein